MNRKTRENAILENSGGYIPKIALSVKNLRGEESYYNRRRRNASAGRLRMYSYSERGLRYLYGMFLGFRICRFRASNRLVERKLLQGGRFDVK